MPSITSNVEFDTIAREWRCKRSEENDKASLIAAQEILESFVGKIKAISGFKNVQRIVCGSCLDFKVIVSVDASEFASWEAMAHTPESMLLEALRSTEGITAVETQTYTISLI